MKINAFVLCVLALGTVSPVMSQSTGRPLTAGAVPPAPSTFGASQVPKRVVIRGTGNLNSSNQDRTSTDLEPKCRQLIERRGSVELTGVIKATGGVDSYYTQAVRDDCASLAGVGLPHVVGMTSHWYENLTATIAGRTGRIRIEATGAFAGDAVTPPGSEVRLAWKITGIDGDLRGMEGEGVSVGLSTAFEGEPAAASTTYAVTLFLVK